MFGINFVSELMENESKSKVNIPDLAKIENSIFKYADHDKKVKLFELLFSKNR